jgi:hypothetical protein
MYATSPNTIHMRGVASKTTHAEHKIIMDRTGQDTFRARMCASVSVLDKERRRRCIARAASCDGERVKEARTGSKQNTAQRGLEGGAENVPKDSACWEHTFRGYRPFVLR